MFRAIALLIAIPSFTSAGARAHEDHLSSLAWLTGCWTPEGGEPGSVEHWLPPAGGSMLGVGRTVKNGKTVDHEFMQIRLAASGKLVFIALPAGQSEATFTAVSVTKNEAIFENLQHDFPQRVIYRSVPGERLEARIEGMRDGKLRGIDFPMKRVPCESSPKPSAAAS